MIDTFKINLTNKSPDDEIAVGGGVPVELSDERNRRRVKVELLQNRRKKEITKDINNRLKSTLLSRRPLRVVVVVVSNNNNQNKILLIPLKIKYTRVSTAFVHYWIIKGKLRGDFKRNPS